MFQALFEDQIFIGYSYTSPINGKQIMHSSLKVNNLVGKVSWMMIFMNCFKCILTTSYKFFYHQIKLRNFIQTLLH